MTLEQHLRSAAARLVHADTPLLDARVLMKHAAGLDDAGLIARANEPLAKDRQLRFEAALERRAQGEPIAYITGRKEFWGLDFLVSPATLIPRPDSECLIEAAIAERSARDVETILDLGVGSGSLLCAMLSEFPQAFAVGVDRSPDAVALAKKNAQRMGLAPRAAFLASDWATALSGTFDIIVANAPYIREAEAPALAVGIRDYEPANALYAGPDGLDAYRAILADAGRLARRGGLVILECGTDQAGMLSEMVSNSFPKYKRQFIKDMRGRRRGVLAVCGTPPKKD